MRLLRLFGIDVRLHPTFFILPFAVGFLYARDFGLAVGARAFMLIVMVFLCVLAHEFSHALQARVYGIRVPHITLYLIGGVASMQRIPRKPSQEFMISLVGPLFNFAFALFLYFPLYALLGREVLFSPSLESWPQTFANLFWINPVLGIFNLLPAFPMDGGRILRSLLAMRLNYWRATRISALLGQFFAILFFLFGIWHRHWTLILIAIFVYFSAENEERQVLREEHVKQMLGLHEER